MLKNSQAVDSEIDLKSLPKVLSVKETRKLMKEDTKRCYQKQDDNAQVSHRQKIKGKEEVPK